MSDLKNSIPPFTREKEYLAPLNLSVQILSNQKFKILLGMKNSLHLSLPLREYLKQNSLQNLLCGAYVVTQQQLEAQERRDNKQIAN